MTQRSDPGTAVWWCWGQVTAEGAVVEVVTERVSRRIDGTEVVRSADPETPADLIEQADGGRVLTPLSERDPAGRRVDENGPDDAAGGG